MSHIFLVEWQVFGVLHSFKYLYLSDLTITKKFANDSSLLKILEICEKTVKKTSFYGCKYSIFSQMYQIKSWFFFICEILISEKAKNEFLKSLIDLTTITNNLKKNFRWRLGYALCCWCSQASVWAMLSHLPVFTTSAHSANGQPSSKRKKSSFGGWKKAKARKQPSRSKGLLFSVCRDFIPTQI